MINDILKFRTVENIEVIEDIVTKMPDVIKSLEKRVVLKDYLRKISNFAKNIVLYQNDIACAFVSIYINDNKNKIAFITLIACLPDKRNLGYGGILFDYTLKLAERIGMQKIRLEVDVENIKAIRFYKNKKMNIVARTSRSLIMEKNL